MDLKKSDFEWAPMPISGVAKIVEICYFNQYNKTNLVVVAMGTVDQPTGHQYETGNFIYKFIASELYKVRNVKLLICEESSTQTSFVCTNKIKRYSPNDAIDFSLKDFQATLALNEKSFDVLKEFAIIKDDLRFSLYLDGENLYRELIASKDLEETLLIIDPTYFDLRMMTNGI